jgi:hypothetical protein
MLPFMQQAKQDPFGIGVITHPAGAYFFPQTSSGTILQAALQK